MTSHPLDPPLPVAAKRDDVRWQTVPNASCGDCGRAVAGSDQCVYRRANGVAVCVCVCVCARPRDIKLKFSHSRYRALGPELIPVYRQSARR